MFDTDTDDEIIASFGDLTFDVKAPVPDGMLRAVKFPTLMWVDKRTPDGRMIHSASSKMVKDEGAPGFSASNFPHPFMAQFKFLPAHMESVPAGRLDRINILKSGKIEGFGYILDNEDGQRLALLIETKVQKGVSADLSGRMVMFNISKDGKSLEIDLLDARLKGLTSVAFPAFPDTKAVFDDLAASCAALPELIVIDGETELNVTFDSLDDLAAAANVPTLPATHVARPEFTEATPVRVVPDAKGAHVFGHVAMWGTCHVGIEGRCVTPPRSRSNYANFATRLVQLDDGSSAWVGPLVLGAAHAPGNLDFQATAEYYGNACRTWADVAIGEDQFGIWISGQVRPDTTEADLRAGMCAAVSGHWKPVRGQLDLIAILSVNAPGFPVPRTKAFADETGMLDLVAAGVIEPSPEPVDVSVAAMNRLAEALERDAARRDADRILAELEDA